MTQKPRESHDPTDMSHPLYDSARDPTSPFYEENEADAGERPDPAEAAYKVGPGFPPKQYTWKKGGPTLNPNGRPRKAPSMKPDVKKAFEDAIFDKVEVKKGDKKVWISKINLGLQQLATQFAKGDRHARRDVFQYAAQLGVDLQAKEIIEEVLGVTEQAIVDAAFRRRAQQIAPEGPPDDHVKAPPDLLDDDVLKPESGETLHAARQPEAKKPPEPVFDEHGRPLPVSDVRHVREIASRRLAELKKNQEGS
jgi:Family of unknown function (DUF5681)